jgi:hypothetical protein
VLNPRLLAAQDADKLLHFYPYIRSPFNYNCSAELRKADRAPYTPGALHTLREYDSREKCVVGILYRAY